MSGMPLKPLNLYNLGHFVRFWGYRTKSHGSHSHYTCCVECTDKKFHILSNEILILAVLDIDYCMQLFISHNLGLSCTTHLPLTNSHNIAIHCNYNCLLFLKYIKYIYFICISLPGRLSYSVYYLHTNFKMHLYLYFRFTACIQRKIEETAWTLLYGFKLVPPDRQG